jgi:hypothetical protein
MGALSLIVGSFGCSVVICSSICCCRHHFPDMYHVGLHPNHFFMAQHALLAFIITLHARSCPLYVKVRGIPTKVRKNSLSTTKLSSGVVGCGRMWSDVVRCGTMWYHVARA